jgi:peroxiredoxin
MKKILVAVIGVIMIIVILFAFFPSLSNNNQYEVKPAFDFTSADEEGAEFSLSDYRGNVTLLHFTGLETPLCVECEEEMKQQLEQLEILTKSNNNVSIITINIRKNPYSTTGKDIAEQTFGINVSWHWVEDYEPYNISGLYQNYWTINGAFSNPTIVLIDTNQSIVGLYNIYCVGKGIWLHFARTKEIEF